MKQGLEDELERIASDKYELNLQIEANVETDLENA